RRVAPTALSDPIYRRREDLRTARAHRAPVTKLERRGRTAHHTPIPVPGVHVRAGLLRRPAHAATASRNSATAWPRSRAAGGVTAFPACFTLSRFEPSRL